MVVRSGRCVSVFSLVWFGFWFGFDLILVWSGLVVVWMNEWMNE
jgi:hypothetical protein